MKKAHRGGEGAMGTLTMICKWNKRCNKNCNR
jgi:hypothetical protein